MRPHLMLMASGACLFLASQGAYAGQCTEEIATLEKTISAKDAGMGPVDTGAAEGTGATAQNDADVPESGELPGTEATPMMNEVTEGKATSPQDVQRQNQGQPTAAEAAEAEKTTPAAGQSEVTDPLQQARELDQAGDEAGCMAAVAETKRSLGAQ